MKIQIVKGYPVILFGLVSIAAISLGAPSKALGEEPRSGTDTGDERKIVVQRRVHHHERPAWASVGGRTYLGIEMIGLTSELREHFGVPADTGIMISRVQEESPAFRAGIEPGDIVTAIDDTAVTTPPSVAKEIASREKGETINLEVWRDGRVETLQATLEERERPMIDIRRFHVEAFDEQVGETVMELEVPEAFGDLTIASPHLDLHPEVLNEALDRLHEELSDPEWHQRVLRFSEHEHELQKQIQDLEGRLEELETELESLTRDR